MNGGTDVSDMGFKQLSIDNWLDRDSTIDFFVNLGPGGALEPLDSIDLLREILAPQLPSNVPLEIRRLFEVARGSMAYGYFFYPLYTLASEQLYTVIEAAVDMRARQLAPDRKFRNLKAEIEFLIELGVVPQEERLRWHAFRELRNLASHPPMQSILWPGRAVRNLEIIGSSIALLFLGM